MTLFRVTKPRCHPGRAAPARSVNTCEPRSSLPRPSAKPMGEVLSDAVGRNEAERAGTNAIPCPLRLASPHQVRGRSTPLPFAGANGRGSTTRETAPRQLSMELNWKLRGASTPTKPKARGAGLCASAHAEEFREQCSPSAVSIVGWQPAVSAPEVAQLARSPGLRPGGVSSMRNPPVLLSRTPRANFKTVLARLRSARKVSASSRHLSTKNSDTRALEIRSAVGSCETSRSRVGVTVENMRTFLRQ